MSEYRPKPPRPNLDQGVIRLEKAAIARAVRLLTEISARDISKAMGLHFSTLYNAADVQSEANSRHRLGPERLRQLAVTFRLLAGRLASEADALDAAAEVAAPVRGARKK